MVGTRRGLWTLIGLGLGGEILLGGVFWLADTAPQRATGPGTLASTPIDARIGATTRVALETRLRAPHTLEVRWPDLFDGPEDRSVTVDWLVTAPSLRISGQAEVAAKDAVLAAPTTPSPGLPIGSYVVAPGVPHEVSVTVRAITGADLGGGPRLEVIVNPGSFWAADEDTRRWSDPVARAALGLMVLLPLWIVGWLWGVRRRRLGRERRGACTACGHPLAGADRCPECGATA